MTSRHARTNSPTLPNRSPDSARVARSTTASCVPLPRQARSSSPASRRKADGAAEGVDGGAGVDQRTPAELLRGHVAARAGEAVLLQHERAGAVLVQVDQVKVVALEVVQERPVVQVDRHLARGLHREVSVQDAVHGAADPVGGQGTEAEQGAVRVGAAAVAAEGGVVEGLARMPRRHHRRTATAPLSAPDPEPVQLRDDHRVAYRAVERPGPVQRAPGPVRRRLLHEPALAVRESDAVRHTARVLLAEGAEHLADGV